MGTVYIIMSENGYDGFDCPPDFYYTSEEGAEKECTRLNKSSSSDRYFVHELVPIKYSVNS